MTSTIVKPKAEIKPGRSHCSAVESYECIAPAGFGVGGRVASASGVARSELHTCAYCSEPVCGPCSTEITGDRAGDPMAGKRVCLSHSEHEIAVWLGLFTSTVR